MLNYPRLAGLMAGMRPASALQTFERSVIPYLIDEWLDDYGRSLRVTDIVEVDLEQFPHLFDIHPRRLIAAWGISRGKHSGARPASRMKRHPKGGGSAYHRGHAIPHTLGGGTDINLAPQLGSMNIGPFRKLENEAVKTPGALYFTYWIYDHPTMQRAHRIQQGLLIPGQSPDIRMHSN
jgi:hypothetical protein